MIFVFEMVTPLRLVIWTLYLIPLFLTVYVRQRLAPIFVTCTIIILSIVGIFLAYPAVPIITALFNRIFFSIVIVVITFFIWNYRKTASVLAERTNELLHKNEEFNTANQELATSQEELLRNVEELGRSEEILRKNEAELRDALLEKDALLSEIHHRVKNNLMAFISMPQPRRGLPGHP